MAYINSNDGAITMPDNETFFAKLTNINFTVRNLSPNRRIKVFNYPINPGQTRDLLAIPEISESDIRHSLIKGELANFIRMGIIYVVSSSIDLLQFDSSQEAFLVAAGVPPSTMPSSLPPSGTAGGDLSGSYPNPTVSGIDGYSIAIPPFSTGYPITLQYPGSGSTLEWSEPILGELSTINDGSNTISLTNKNQWYFVNLWTNSISNGVTANDTDGYFTFNTGGWYKSSLGINFSCQTGTQLVFSSLKNGVVDTNNQASITVYGGITGTPEDDISSNHIDTHNPGDTVGLVVMQTNSASPIIFGINYAHWDKFMIR